MHNNQPKFVPFPKIFSARPLLIKIGHAVYSGFTVQLACHISQIWIPHNVQGLQEVQENTATRTCRTMKHKPDSTSSGLVGLNQCHEFGISLDKIFNRL